jgi:GNAT superfamily N-acetyltransferase
MRAILRPPASDFTSNAAPAPVPSGGQPLSDAEFAVAQAFTQRCINDILQLGLAVHIERDFEAFAGYRGRVGDGFCYPTFHPSRCTIGAADFWLRVVDDRGETVSALATRIFEDVEDFYQLMRSEVLWDDRSLRAIGRCEPVCAIPKFGGAIAHNGGMWVDPARRGHGLAKLLHGMSRALALRNSAIDFDTGLVFEPLVRVAITQYRFPRCELVIEGYFPPTAKPERVFLCQISRAEALASMSLAAVDDRKPMSAVA